MSCLWIEANKMFKIRWIFKLNSNWFLCLFYYICHNFGFSFPNVPWTSWLCSPSSSSHPTLLIESALYNHILYNHNPVIGRYMMRMVMSSDYFCIGFWLTTDTGAIKISLKALYHLPVLCTCFFLCRFTETKTLKQIFWFSWFSPIIFFFCSYQ